VECVVETMRPLPIEPMLGVPAFVRGLSIVRGVPIPVIDLSALLGMGESGARCGRFIVVRVGERRAALAVESVVGLRELDVLQMRDLPPLLQPIGVDVVESIGTSDAQLLVVLRGGRLLPDDVWASLEIAPEVR
jgi:purine-binding chemotaxis protein CheW